MRSLFLPKCKPEITRISAVPVRIVAKKLNILKMWYDPCLYGGAEILVIFCLQFGRNIDLIFILNFPYL